MTERTVTLKGIEIVSLKNVLDAKLQEYKEFRKSYSDGLIERDIALLENVVKQLS